MIPAQLLEELSILAVAVGADIADTAVDSAAADGVLFATRDAQADAASMLATVTFVKDVAYFITASAVAHMAQESVSKLRQCHDRASVLQSVWILVYSSTIVAVLAAALCPILLHLSSVVGVPKNSLDTVVLLIVSVMPMTCSRLMEQWIIALGLDEAVVGVAVLASAGKVVAFTLLYWHSGVASASSAILLSELLACVGIGACLWWALSQDDPSTDGDSEEQVRHLERLVRVCVRWLVHVCASAGWCVCARPLAGACVCVRWLVHVCASTGWCVCACALNRRLPQRGRKTALWTSHLWKRSNRL
jgi:hypothetical protein